MKRLAKALFDRLGIPIYWLRQSAHEAKAAWVRIWALLPIQRSRVRELLRKGPVRLNFGCGETSYDGWIGVDQFFAPQVTVTLDLRGRLPFPDDSVDLCYSEHFMEHLSPPEGQRHLSEVHRILKPDGRYRVVVPDVLKFAKAYLEKDDAFFHRAFPWASRPMEALYSVANWNGEHRNILDYDEFVHMGRAAGFASVRLSAANESEVAELRIDKSDPQRVEESLYVELIKGGKPA